MEKKISRVTKLYPWYVGLTGDLLFYIAIDTLFLTVVKNFSEAQIVSITTISMFTCILIQIPILRMVEKLGNTLSVRLGGLCLLLSALFITFGPGYFFVLAGRVFHDVAVVFRHTSYVTLSNNLDLVGRRDDYTKIRTDGNTVYSVATMIIAFIASFMFNVNPYLPMLCCITTCTVGFVLSFFIVDYSDYDKSTPEKEKSKVKMSFGKIVTLALIFYGTFYSFISAGQNEGKLYMQQQLLRDFDVEKTALILGAVIAVSRMVRVFSNLVFHRVYVKIREKVGMFLTVIMSISIGLILFGSFVPHTFTKILLMGMGYCMILFLRDPITLLMQDVLLNSTRKEMHRTVITYMQLIRNIAQALINFSFTCILIKFPLVTVIVVVLAATLVEMAVFAKLYKMITAAKTVDGVAVN